MQYFYPEGQLLVSLYFALVGAGLCMLYDIFRIKRAFFGSARIVVFFDDFLYMLMCALVVIVGILKINSGNVRWYEIVFACVGFFLYRVTLSRIVMAFFFMLSRMLKRTLRCLCSAMLKILRPLLLPLKKLLGYCACIAECIHIKLLLEKYKVIMMRKIKLISK